jgi:hypothetical protein
MIDFILSVCTGIGAIVLGIVFVGLLAWTTGHLEVEKISQEEKND